MANACRGGRALCLAALAIVAVADAGCSHKAIPRSVDGGADADAGAVVDGPAGQGGSGSGGAPDDGGAVLDGSDGGGMGGQQGGDGGAIAGLVSIEVTPPAQLVDLSATAVGGSLMATATFVAIGHMSDGHTEDVSTRVSWPSSFESLRVSAGIATVRAPGTYTIRATSGAVTGSATLTAIFSGSRFAPVTDPLNGSSLDGAPARATTIAYPLDHAILPPNLAPLTVHIARDSAAQAIARLRFTAAGVLDLSYYAPCQPGVGDGCYIDVPLEVTRWFIAVSETQDITLTARVGGTGATLIESAPIQLAWANVPLSGGLYFWTAMTAGVVSGYVPPNAGNLPAPSGSGVWRYAFDRVGVSNPELVYTDRGRAPVFQGSPPAADGSFCIGCHAISGDGKTMALTVGGSSSPDFALLDLPTLNLTVLDAAASSGAQGPTDINYYKQFRRSGIAAETAFGPGGDVMVNMYRSGLTLRGTTASLLNQGVVVPSWPEYKSDPFWSASGKIFVFTSFATPDLGTYNESGLNGDMKRGGQIAIASADERAVHDDARMLVPREPNVTRYYPAVSADDQLVIYDQSACGIDPDVYTSAATGVYGSQTCDGYDDSSASLWLTTPAAATSPVRLDRLNGGSAVGNSRPQWGPVSGTFRGQRLYWVAFSSRRPYGLQANLGAPLTTRPQLWLGAVLMGGSLPADPSSPPVWLPNQNPTPAGGAVNQTPAGNHTPQWTRVAVPIPG